MPTEYYPGAAYPHNSFYLSCGSEESTLVGYKGTNSTCPFVQFQRYPVPASGDETWWAGFNLYAKPLASTSSGGLYSMHPVHWEELFGDGIYDEWGYEDGDDVYFIMSDEICLYRLNWAFE